jgi:hypothetical protein
MKIAKRNSDIYEFILIVIIFYADFSPFLGIIICSLIPSLWRKYLGKFKSGNK